MFSSKDIFFTPPSGGYRIEKSLRFRSSASAYLNRTFGTPTNNKIWTYSFWAKIGALSSARAFIGTTDNNTASGNFGAIYLTSSNNLEYFEYSSAYTIRIVTTQVFRDPSAWYHIVVSVDTPQATASNRIKLYVNGSQVTALSTATYPSLNYNTYINSAIATYQGCYNNAGTGTLNFFDGYLAEVNFIDGQALTPSSFGETDATTGVWKPKAYTGTYGTNGFYLKFTDVGATSSSNTGYGQDFSGNANRWTTNNFGTTSTATTYDSMWDTPTPYDDGGNGVGNYCVVNPLDASGTNTVSNGNLTYLTGATFGLNRSTFSITSGKIYWEVTSFSGIPGVGVSRTDVAVTNAGHTTANGWAYFGDTGNKWTNNSGTAYGASYGTTDVIGVALDMDAGTLTFYKNGVSQGVAFNSGLLGNSLSPMLTSGLNVSGGTFNFGQRPFAHTPPSGFKALNTQNLPTPTIAAGDDYFNVILYTGTGASNARTGVGFQPDFVWIKERNAAADHGLYDAVRGVQKQLESNTTTDETTETTGLTAFDADGFTVGALAQLNTNNDTYVAWNWKESAAAGFDIVTYTGNGTARTISHNLNATPNMIIVKARTTASTDQGWPVYHSANTAAPATDYLMLNTTAATADLDTVWNDTSPTDAVFSVGTNALVNANNDTYVAYLWSAVAGYSAFGSYTGNGSADGPFVFTGFRPRWIMIKISSTGGSAGLDWYIFDTSRDTYNAADLKLIANGAVSENQNSGGSSVAGFPIDILSNGFKIRNSGGNLNTSGGTFIYAAFAENPFKFSLAR
jgi:hypothetical protein